ncbi:mitochondrial carrier domain-containing protein, partial [Baffinella frigidus]
MKQWGSGVKPQEEKRAAATVMALLTRKEASVPWKDLSIKPLFGYGSALYFVEQALSHPSNLLKTRLQVDMRVTTDLRYDWLHLCRHIRKTEGYRGFFRGFWFNTSAGIPAQLAYLVTYNWCKERVENLGGPEWKDSAVAPLCAGALAETITSVFWVPLDVVTQKLQIQEVGGTFQSPIQVARGIIEADGARGLWRGMGAHLVAFVPQAAVWWGIYEQSKKFLVKRVPESANGVPVHLASGISAGVVNAIVSNPLDIMKVRVQCQIGADGGAFRTIANMLRTEG